MEIGLVVVDGHAKKKKWGATIYPNIAIGKIARWHRQQGDTVEWAFPFKHYDRIYISKVFNFTADDRTAYDADEIIRGGTGYEDIDTENTDYWTEWRDNGGHFTITEMLDILKTYVEADIALYKEQGRAFRSRGSLACGASLNIAHLRQLRDDCSGWEVDDYTVEP